MMNEAVATELELLRGIFNDDGLVIEEKRQEQQEEDGNENENEEASLFKCLSGLKLPLFSPPFLFSFPPLLLQCPRNLVLQTPRLSSHPTLPSLPPSLPPSTRKA